MNEAIQSSGAIPYHKGRVVGTFDVHVAPENRVRVEVAAAFSGKEYFGTTWFENRGRTQHAMHASCTSFRTRSYGDDTPAARRALIEAAQQVAITWAAAHPKAFDAADLEHARSELARAEKEVADLKEKLAAAEKTAETARVRVRLLEPKP